MKNKYQRMSKEEKKSLIERFKKDSFGKLQMSRLQRLTLTGSLGIIVAIAMPVLSFLVDNEIGVFTYVMSIILLVMSLVFIIGSYLIKGRDLNSFAIKEMNMYKGSPNSNRKKRK